MATRMKSDDDSTGILAQRRGAPHLNSHPTEKTSTDWTLHSVDKKMRSGLADWVERGFSYLLFGGCAVVVNLLVFSLVYYRLGWPADQQWHYAIAFAVASEVSILTNFVPNDAITFRHLPGHSRPWPVRCARFHATYVLGTLLQLCLSFSLHLLSVPALLAQAVAIGTVTAFNFAFHHLFTYRRAAYGGKIK